jgi:hypothetical protein
LFDEIGEDARRVLFGRERDGVDDQFRVERRLVRVAHAREVF